MNLVLIISSLNAGGAERVLSELANHWVSKNHHVSLLTLETPNAKPFYVLDPKMNIIQLDQTYTGSCVLTRFRNIGRRIFYLRTAIKSLKPDLIISFVDIMNITTIIATMGLKIPVIVSERIDPHFHRIPRLYTWLRFKIYPFCERLIMQTESAARYFPEKFRRFIRIIPNPVSAPKNTKEKIPENVKHIISVGRLDSQKDHKTLVCAFAKLVAVYPNLSLTIYGEGHERQNLEKLISSLVLEEKIYLPGTIKNTHEALINADLFVFPSLYEGFPNALCEAMAVGLPVIASSCSGNVDIVRDGIDGRLFPIGDIQALTSVVSEMINDWQQRQSLSQHAKEVSARFQSDSIFALWDAVIENGSNKILKNP